MKFGVVIFPGSNCDQDMVQVLRDVCAQDVVELWHKDTTLEGFTEADCIIIPGGFSYGDYLRTGAIARFSPIMEAVSTHAAKGGKVWGICNGFQILCEAGLLPGVLLKNDNQKYNCKNIYLKVKNTNSLLTRSCQLDEVLKIPIAHGDGRFYADEATLKSMKQNEQILFTYCDEKGSENEESNPNGSLMNIAGICNDRKNVFGMMPHPERASEAILGNTDGYKLFASIINETIFHS